MLVWGCRRLSLLMVLSPFWHYFQSTYQQTNGNKKAICWPFDPLDWPSSNFSLQYHPWITHEGHENKRNDHQLRKLLIVWQILFVSTLKNVQRTVWRICILILGCKGLNGKLFSWYKLKKYTQCSTFHMKGSIFQCSTNAENVNKFLMY